MLNTPCLLTLAHTFFFVFFTILYAGKLGKLDRGQCMEELKFGQELDKFLGLKGHKIYEEFCVIADYSQTQLKHNFDK